jgi:hypothetical protein
VPTKALIEGVRTEMGRRSPIIRRPDTAAKIRAELASYEAHYGVSTADLKAGARVPRHIASRWLALHARLVQLEDAEHPSAN